jgi:hypothetical protein
MLLGSVRWTAGGIDDRVDSAAIEEALLVGAVTIEVPSDDLSLGINAVCNGYNAARGIDRRVRVGRHLKPRRRVQAARIRAQHCPCQAQLYFRTRVD